MQIMVKKRIFALPAVVFLAAIVLIVYYVTLSSQRTEKEQWEEWEQRLMLSEAVIDGIVESDTAYLLVSREGRPDYGDLFVVFTREQEAWVRSYENDFSSLKPWKIDAADIDGDGTKEILIAVRKKAHYDKQEKNRMFIFNYDGERLVKKWTGSQSTQDWRDFTAGNILSIPGEELIFIETSKNNKEFISIYYWFDFGFLKLADSAEYQEIQSVKIMGDNRLQLTYGKSIRTTVVLRVKEGELIESATDRQS